MSNSLNLITSIKPLQSQPLAPPPLPPRPVRQSIENALRPLRQQAPALLPMSISTPPFLSAADRLYPDIVNHFLYFLSVDEMVKARRVCRLWNAVTIDKVLIIGTPGIILGRLKDKHIDQINNYQDKLKIIKFIQCWICDIPDLPQLNLRTLYLQDCYNSDKILQSFSTTHTLTSLILRSSDVQDTKECPYKRICQFKRLNTLYMQDMESSYFTSLDNLSQLGDLNKLYLRQTYNPISRNFNSFQLSELPAKGTIGYPNIVKLEKNDSMFSSLSVLDLTGTWTNDEFLEKLSNQSPRLTELNLTYTRLVTDKGIAHLAKLSSLTQLDISYCKFVTDTGIAALSESLPKLKVVHCGD